MAYELYYWDGIQGRGEFVRLALEEAGADYIDITRQPGRGTGAMFDIMKSDSEPHIPFAPPFLKDGDLIVPHVANILFYLGPKLGLAPQDEGLRHVVNGLQLTVTDFVAEVHDTHHPIDMSLFTRIRSRKRKPALPLSFATAFRNSSVISSVCCGRTQKAPTISSAMRSPMSTSRSSR